MQYCGAVEKYYNRGELTSVLVLGFLLDCVDNNFALTNS
jgi:hypothetical protein